MQLRENPKVSVIMNCLNCEKYLKEAIDSVYAQTYGDWEIIFWDNTSTDGSAEIAKSYDGHLRYFRGEETIPLGAARNKALEQARGEFIAFLDCDDLWVPEKLGKQIPLFEGDSDLGLVFSDAIYFSDKGRRFQLYGRKKPPSGRIFRDLLKHYFLCLGTVVLRKDALMKIGEWFDERFTVAEEADVFMRVAYEWKCDCVDEPLMMYRMHENNLTSLMPELFPQEAESILRKLSHLHANMDSKYEQEIDVMKANIQYGYAMEDFKLNRRKMVRKRLAPYLMTRKKVCVPYFFSFLPFRFYRSLVLHFSRFGYR
jgi:glycosyltransferase involved in cell wall biosynthesis